MRSKRQLSDFALGVGLAFALLCLPAFSQDSTGRIFGTITLQDGDAAVGAHVTVINVARGLKQVLIADNIGRYDASSLTPGTYTVQAEARGFKVSEHAGLEVSVGKEVQLDLTLHQAEPTMASLTQPLAHRDLLHEEHLSSDIGSLYVAEQLGNSYFKADILWVQLRGVFPIPGLQIFGPVDPDDPVVRCIPRISGDENDPCVQVLKHPPKPLGNLAIQVWLLRADGTSLVQKAKFGPGPCAGPCDDKMTFVFEHVAPKELAGVVMRVDGKFFIREISSN